MKGRVRYTQSGSHMWMLH